MKRENHPLPATDESLAELGRSKIFSKLDANCGYWQMRLHPDSQKLTAFITPFGRFFCRRLPFGISSAPEVFQREMQKALVGVENVICQMDDILIHTVDKDTHTRKVREVLGRLKDAGITLNSNKCEFFKSQVTFLGHIIDESGIRADPEKVKAIAQFPAPRSRKDLKRFFGMVNYLGKFSSTLADDTVHLRSLLKRENDWLWCEEQQREFVKLKEKISSVPVLAPFVLEADTWLSTDASSFGLGAALFQRDGDVWRPIAFASRAMSETEQRYAQIEKEALAICWASEKFYYYLAGRKFSIEIDHKPLVSLMGERELSKLPLRVQRFRLRMMRFSYSIEYTPGDKLVLADTLSRAPLRGKGSVEPEPMLVLEMVDELPISANRLRRLQEATSLDEVGSMLMVYTLTSWPSVDRCPSFMKRYYAFRDQLTVVQGLVFFGSRLFIPACEREKVLAEIHKGHQGENKCCRRATELVWWPGLTTEVREMVKGCGVCRQHRRVSPEPMIATPFPDRPWWRLAIDLCSVDEAQYIVIVDYFSRFIVAEKLESTEAGVVCSFLEKLFSLIGFPHTIVSDNGPQFGSEVFADFVRRRDIVHRTSSQRYAQANGEAERAVQTFKSLAAKSNNVDMALCAYRDSPLQNGYSPAQLMFGRQLNSMGVMNSTVIDLKRVSDYEKSYRSKQTAAYNSRHRVINRENIPVGTRVQLSDPGAKPCSAVVVASAGRELALQKANGNVLRRNRAFVTPEACSNSGVRNESDMAGAVAPAESLSPPPVVLPRDLPVMVPASVVPVMLEPSDGRGDSSVELNVPVAQRHSSRLGGGAVAPAGQVAQGPPSRLSDSTVGPVSGPVDPVPARSRYGRRIKPPDRLNL